MTTPVVSDIDSNDPSVDLKLNDDEEIILNILDEPHIKVEEAEEILEKHEELEEYEEENIISKVVSEYTEEELAEMEAERLQEEEFERERLEAEQKQMEMLNMLREKLAELAKWNRIREEEGSTFMNRIKRFLAQNRDDPSNLCFVNHLPNTTVMEGKNVRISCSVNGTDLEVKWFKDGKEIHSNDRYIMSINLYDILSLEIINCFTEDSGEYTCVITNGEKQASSSCFISVCDMTSFKAEPRSPTIEYIKDRYHCMNDELEIECRVIGTPRPIVTWFRNNYQLKTDPFYTITEKSHGIHTLLIKNPICRPKGFYTIKAKNSIGEDVQKHVAEFFVGGKKVVF
ncbi:palladin-like [Condylostylus longicornis]|uniref:palladin-like n=1 Tax=Condylostylus longicornis TaxID=2530218 RepID=UPI00244DB825|nr:palladin-like [Condylostylus longicornis]